jgi:membrane-associated phospholipid phosphatase
MSSISHSAERTTASVGNGVAINPPRLRIVVGRWLMFSDYGAATQRHLAIVWSCVLGCALVDAVWLPNSRLSFASSNWTDLLRGIVCCALAGAFIAVASSRLRGDARYPAVVLRTTLIITELLWRTALPIGALLTAGATLSYLITSADLPLQDALLARVDRNLGFDWLHFLDTTNSSPFLAALLARVYQTIGQVAELVIIWLALTRRGERLAELIAILSLSTVGLCVGMWLVPAAGAFAYYGPAPQLVENFSAMGKMWPFAHTFTMLRNGSLSVIDLSALQGVVSFPSFHTMLGVMTTYALRDTRWLMILVLLLNGTMIVSTLPVGGHHLTDVLAGAGLTFGAIFLVRRRTNFKTCSQELATAKKPSVRKRD